MTATPDGYRHHVLFYDSAADLVDKAVPFLRNGLEAGEAAVLACGPEMRATIADALGDPRVVLLELSRDGRPNAGLSVYRHLVRDLVTAGAARVRVVADMDEGRQRHQWADRARYEAACNLGFAELPATGVCVYRNENLIQPLRDFVLRTHPYELGRDGSAESGTYVDPALVLREIPVPRADPAEAGEPVLVLSESDGVGDLATHRRRVTAALADAGVATGLATDFAKAVHEVLVNALVHGKGVAQLRLWITADRLVCTVTDAGAGFDSRLAGFTFGPSTGRGTGTGLWLARQLCDQLSTARTTDGFVVRLVADRTVGQTTALGARARASAAALRAEQARVRAEDARRVLTWNEAQL